MTSQEEINKQGQAYISGLAQTVRQLWGKMCQEAGIPEDSSFVDAEAFKGSKYLPFYDKALAELFEARRQYAAGGYVGLTLKNTFRRLAE